MKHISVTGFGPFRSYDVNISSESVKLLPKLWNELEYPSKFNAYLNIVTDMPVSYEFVEKAVESMWSTEPNIMIHVGLHGNTDYICLEAMAHNGPYDSEDVCHKKCGNALNSCIENGDDCLETSFNVEEIKEYLKEKGKEVIVSKHPGLYLCGYIYYRSLHRNRNTLFIHVPENADAEETAKTILEVIEFLLTN